MFSLMCFKGSSHLLGVVIFKAWCMIVLVMVWSTPGGRGDRYVRGQPTCPAAWKRYQANVKVKARLKSRDFTPSIGVEALSDLKAFFFR